MISMFGGEMTFSELQDETAAWAKKNFPDSWNDPNHQLLGITEEVGELAHARLKKIQGIRGSHDSHVIAGKDAVGDILVYLANYCNAEGWSMQAIIEQVWGEVSKRDWTKNKQTGQV